jgi:hypothetical protein
MAYELSAFPWIVSMPAYTLARLRRDDPALARRINESGAGK